MEALTAPLDVPCVVDDDVHVVLCSVRNVRRRKYGHNDLVGCRVPRLSSIRRDVAAEQDAVKRHLVQRRQRPRRQGRHCVNTRK